MKQTCLIGCGNIISMWSVNVLGARVMGLACDVGNTLSTLAWPGYVLLSPATITSTPLLIFFVAK